MVAPVATVVVCTHNRDAYIGRCLKGLEVQELAAPFEVIVVDNCSTDDTVKVAKTFLDCLPLRITHEPQLGLSNARNRGLKEARSDIIIYLDDDAVAQPGWLAELVRCFVEIKPRPASVGGRILLDWNGPALSWVSERYYGLFGFVNISPRTERLDVDVPPRGLYSGGNMAFDRSVLEEIGGFSPKLGYKGTNLLSGEESLILLKLIAARRGVYYTPDAVVNHIVLPERRSRSYYARRLFAQGKANIAVATEAGELSRWRIPDRVARELLGVLRASMRCGAESLRFNFAAAEMEGWEGVKRLGRLSRLLEHALEPLKVLRSS